MHKNIKRIWYKWEIIEGIHTQIMVIETDLELECDAEKFNSSELDDVLEIALKSSKNAAISRVEIVPFFD